MKKDEAMKLSENAISELADALASGKSEQLVKYLDTMSSFPPSWPNRVLRGLVGLG